MCADLCQTGFCLSIIENRNFPESSILYLASKGVFSFICLSAGSKERSFQLCQVLLLGFRQRKRSFNQA
jgi:phosphatidate phosphatase APP1